MKISPLTSKLTFSLLMVFSIIAMPTLALDFKPVPPSPPPPWPPVFGGKKVVAAAPINLPVLEMTLENYIEIVEDLKIDKFDSPLDSYEIPNDLQSADFSMAFNHLISGAVVVAENQFNALGYELKYLSNNGQPLIALEENTFDDLGRYQKGWGGCVFPVTALQGIPEVSSSNKPILFIMAPHTLNEKRTALVADGVFSDLIENPAIANNFNVIHCFNTAWRNNSMTASDTNPANSAADFSRDSGTTGRIMSIALTNYVHSQGNNIIHVGLHGFNVENHEEEPEIMALPDLPEDIVLGNDAVSTLHIEFYNQLILSFPTSYLCGDNWPVDDLCGNTDQLYYDIMDVDDLSLHLEIETQKRNADTFADTSDNIAQALMAALLIIYP